MAPSRDQFQVDNRHFVEIANQKQIVTNFFQDNVGTLLVPDDETAGASALHTNSAPKTIDRSIDAFPKDTQEQVRTMLGESLKGVICRQLLKKADGKGRAAVCAKPEKHAIGSPQFKAPNRRMQGIGG